MSASRPRSPKYRHYKPKDLGVVRLDGKDVYLGKFNSPESLQKYHRLVANWLAGEPLFKGKEPANETIVAQPESTSVNDLILAYMQYALVYYRRDGEASREIDGIRYSLRPLRQLYGLSAADKFGPKCLKAIRQHMIAVQNLSRMEINKRIGRIKRLFRWAVSEELIPAAVDQALQTVFGLQKGRTAARESAPVRPVPEADVEALLPFLAPPVAAIVELQRLTGMRPGEVVKMKASNIDMTAEVWTYVVPRHKTDWRGHERVVVLGPRSQQVLRPFLNRPPSSFLFCPRESLAWQLDRRELCYKKDRKTPIYPCEIRAREKAAAARRQTKLKRKVGDHYTTRSYWRALQYAVKRAEKAGVKISPWHPHQLRHSRGTQLRRLYGIEGSRVSLGHASLQSTEVYAERDTQLAIKIAREVG